MAQNQELNDEIDAFLKEYAALWDRQEPAGLIELWDQDDAEPFYLAEEQDEWRIGWDQVKSYWKPSDTTNVESIRMRFDTIQARLLADDLAFAKFWIRFDTKMKFMPKPIGTDARASAVFRKKPDGWRLLTWAEAPQSPMIYMQKLNKKNTQPDFDKFMLKLYEQHTRPDFAEFMKTHQTK